MAKALIKMYNPRRPYIVEKIDNDDGSCQYEVIDTRPQTYRILAIIHEDGPGDEPVPARGQAMADANLIVTALNHWNEEIHDG